MDKYGKFNEIIILIGAMIGNSNLTNHNVIPPSWPLDLTLFSAFKIFVLLTAEEAKKSLVK